MRHSFWTLRQEIGRVLARTLPEPDERALAELLAFVTAYNTFRAHDVLMARPLPAAAPRMSPLLIGDESRSRLVYSSVAQALALPYVYVFAGDFVANGYVGQHLSDLAATIYRTSGDDPARARRAIVHFAGLEAVGERDITGDVGGLATQRTIESLLLGTDLVPLRDSQVFQPLATHGIQFVFSARCDNMVESIRRRRRGGYDIDADEPLSPQACLSVTVDDLIRELRLARSFAELLPIRAILPPPAPGYFQERLQEGSLYDLSRFTSYLQHIAGVPLALHPSIADVLMTETQHAEGNLSCCASVLARYLGTQAPANPEAHRQVEIDGETLAGNRPAWLYGGRSPLQPPTIFLDEMDSDGVVNTNPESFCKLTEEQIRSRLSTLRESMGWEDCKNKPAGRFWRTVERENQHRLPMLLKLAHDLWVVRKATIEEFHSAWIYCNCTGVAGILHFLDYSRARAAEERERKNGGTSDRTVRMSDASTTDGVVAAPGDIDSEEASDPGPTASADTEPPDGATPSESKVQAGEAAGEDDTDPQALAPSKPGAIGGARKGKIRKRKP